MPSYNTPVQMLKEAVDSILTQSFPDFEFIIIDDCSTNESVDYLLGLCDPRIKLIRNQEHFGVTKSLNIGFKAAEGKYIARMDCDDISLPDRFEKQFVFMESHPDVIVCGTNVAFFGFRGGASKNRTIPMEMYRIRALFVNPGPPHPTAFFNHELLDRYQLSYDERLVYAQDYGLYVEISKVGKVRVLSDVLLRHRLHESQITAKEREKQIQCDKITMEKQLRELLGNVSNKELDLHYAYSTGYYSDVMANADMLDWYRRLVEANNRTGIYNKRLFKYYVYDVIVKRTVYQSFQDNISFSSRITMLFRYLPFSIALKTLLGMSARSVLSYLTTLRKH